MLIVRTPDGRLTWLQALPSRRKGDVAAGIPAAFTGLLMTDGYTGYQHLLSRLAGIQQCCQHIIRRCRAVIKLGPGGLQSWAGRHHRPLARGAPRRPGRPRPRQHRPGRGPAGGAPPALRRGRRLRDHPQPAAGLARGEPPRLRARLLAARLQEQVFLFTRDFAADWTTNVAERGAKAAKRHQAVSGDWHTLATLARWCRIRSYLDSAAAHGVTALDAIRDALAGKPWLPPPPAAR